MVILSLCSLIAIIVSTCILVTVINSKSNSKEEKQLHCEICGTLLYPNVNTTYTINTSTGVYLTPELYDAMDCPVCGGQIILGRRYKKS